MNPIQTDATPKSENLAGQSESAENVRFAHSSQEKKRNENRRKASRYMKDLQRRSVVGDMLYMVGFWVEYVFVCVGRRLGAVLHGVADAALNLLLIVLRPILIGLITLVEDLTGPFVRMASGIRHIQALPDTMEEQICHRRMERDYIHPARRGSCGPGGHCARRPGPEVRAERAGERRKRRLCGERAGV